MNLFEVVKANINTQEAAQTYGIDVNHYGMALCPFHNDRHPSLYISDDHYHCFACGEHGDVIDLTAKLFDLRLYDAARKLASDFHLALDKPLPEAIRQKLKHKGNMHRKRRKMCWTSGLWKPATVCPGQSISWTFCCKAIPMNEAKS